MGESPFHLCFRVEALILVEIGSLSMRNLEFHALQNERLLHEHLLFWENTRDAAAKQDEEYKRAAARYQNSHVRTFGIQEGDWVLRKNQVK